MFTASTQPRSSAALRRMGPASAPRGGPSSAVTANRPAASAPRSPAVPAPPGLLALLTRCSFPRSPRRHALAAPDGTQLHLPPAPPGPPLRCSAVTLVPVRPTAGRCRSAVALRSRHQHPVLEDQHVIGHV